MISTERPYAARSIDSIMSSGLLEFKQPLSFEVFCSGPSRAYLDHIRQKYPQIRVRHDGKTYFHADNMMRALTSIKDNTEFLLLLEDDIVVCRNFIQYIDQFCEEFKHQFQVFSFYTPYIEVEDAFNKGLKIWCYPPEKFYAGLALAFKPHVVEDYLKEYHNNLELHRDLPDGFHGDIRLNRYLTAHKIMIGACVPNLTQHIGDNSTLPTELKRTQSVRTCPCFIGEQKSPF